MNRNQLESEYQLKISFEKKVKKRTFGEEILPSNQYQIMVTWILEINSESLSLFDFIQHLDSIESSGATKYLAKSYLDSYLCLKSQIKPEELHLIAICAVRIAVKSLQYPLSFAQKIGGFKYLEQDFHRMELQMLTTINFNLNFVTPHSYIPVILSLINLNDQIIKQIDAVIDFCCTLKELVHISAGEMFLSAILYLAHCYDISNIDTIKAYGSTFENIGDIVILLDQKASESEQQTIN